ncbi:MAG: copper chaperone [Oscillospiraceae bacterium]|nr:copper chaperone [Oscillospiraceae bacterium]
MSKASAYFNVTNVNGKHDVKQLKRELDTFRGVISVSVNDLTECIAVDFDTTGVKTDQLAKKIETLGFEITGSIVEDHIM